MSTRLDDLGRLYQTLSAIESAQSGPRKLLICNGRGLWPRRGVYFFFEAREERSDSGAEPRVIRVGTYALTAMSKTTLWQRLAQHKGTTIRSSST
jgi:hypothetical protein